MSEQMSEEASAEAVRSLSPEMLATLVARHREFVRYVERRIGDRATAEEIVQEAFVRSLDRAADVRESVVGWFYRVLRNAVIDRQRRQSVQNRRLDALAIEMAGAEGDEEWTGIACRCVLDFADALKPEYADILRRVDVEGLAVKDYADQSGITASNAGVRVFRAREALRRRVAEACGTCAVHGCLDCSCDEAPRRAPE